MSINGPVLVLLAISLYIGIGAVVSWYDARDLFRADPARLCSDPCRQHHQSVLPDVAQMLSAPDGALPYLICEFTWPVKLLRRCRCVRRAARTL